MSDNHHLFAQTAEDLQDEIEWIQSTLVSILNEHTKVITICARAKRW